MNKKLHSLPFLLVFFLMPLGYLAQEKSIFDIARSGSLVELKAAYQKDSNCINILSQEGYSPITLACYYSNNEVAKFLIDTVKDINTKSSYGTPLMAAVVKNNAEIAALLIQKGADVNAKDPNNTTALHYAVLFGLVDITELLVKNKADKTIKDNRGNTAIDYANIKGNTTILQLLNN